MTKTTTLLGTPADWTVKLTAGQLVFSSPKYPTRVIDPRPVVFEEDLIFDVVNDKFVPRVALPSTGALSQADLDRARAEGRAEGLAAARKALAGVV